MTWRPVEYLIEGELDNTIRQRVTGWMRFSGMMSDVTFDLEGEFHRDIRGTTVRLRGDAASKRDRGAAAADCMHLFATHQTGVCGHITAGLPPRDYGSYPYVEWYSSQNGRVVLDLNLGQMDVIGTPIPACESDPISREDQKRLYQDYLYEAFAQKQRRRASDTHRRNGTGSRPGRGPWNT